MRAILAAAKITLPTVLKNKMKTRDVSPRTRKLFDIRANMSRTKHLLTEFDRVQVQIRESSIQDYRDWIERNVQEMEKANERGDVSRIYELLRNLSDSPKQPPQNLTTDEDGNLIKSSWRSGSDF